MGPGLLRRLVTEAQGADTQFNSDGRAKTQPLNA